jgi:hypothetical protein
VGFGQLCPESQASQLPMNVRRLTRSLALREWLLVGLSAVAFACGFLFSHYKWPPYYMIKHFYKDLISPKRGSSSAIVDANAVSPIGLQSADDATKMRTRLRAFIWGKDGFPTDAPPKQIESDVRQGFLAVRGSSRVDRLVTEMEYGFNSIAYLFYPISTSKKLLIYHQGHSAEPDHDKRVISYFLERGHHVLFLRMPLFDGNNQPHIHLEKVGLVKFQTHDQLKFLERGDFNPLKLFFEPVTRSLNYALGNARYDMVAMVGISGGAWLTSVYAALDERVTQSYPVAGTSPIFIRFALPESDWGDYEQTHPKLYSIANQLEMYVLASHGQRRKQVQVFNEYDPCCFSGLTSRVYEQAVKEKVRQLGEGHFSVWLDDTHYEHKISNKALHIIETAISARPID